MRLRRLATVALTAAVLVLPSTPVVAAGSPGYSLLTTTGHAVIRWNPCVPIRYKVNVAHAPKGSLAEVKTAIAKLHAASGLIFVYQGQTNVIPQSSFGLNGRPGHWPALTIAWAAPGTGKGRSTALLRKDVGVGGVFFNQRLESDGRLNPQQVV